MHKDRVTLTEQERDKDQPLDEETVLVISCLWDFFIVLKNKILSASTLAGYSRHFIDCVLVISLVNGLCKS